MTGRLQDRIALITGSDSGIGQATATEFAKEGADLVVHYFEDAAGAEETRQKVEAEGRRAIVVQADIADEEQVGRLFDEAVKEFGRVDILMNNAGVDASGDEVADLATEIRKLRIDSGSCRRARLDVGSKVMSWSRNWPRNVNPAVIVGLFGLSALFAGSVMSVIGFDTSSPASMGPPGAPSSMRASRIDGVSAANGGSVGKSRPNRPSS